MYLSTYTYIWFGRDLCGILGELANFLFLNLMMLSKLLLSDNLLNCRLNIYDAIFHNKIVLQTEYL